MSGFRNVTWPAVTQLPTWVGSSLQTGDLGVLEGGSESNHGRHVFAIVGKVVPSQAEGKWKQRTLSGFRSVTSPTVTHHGKSSS
eukprot:7367013-Prymnesium_polylepis.1